MVKLFSKNSKLCDHNPPTLQTDGQTDRQMTCDRSTALCTKVHRAVKSNISAMDRVVVVKFHTNIANRWLFIIQRKIMEWLSFSIHKVILHV